jgi:hypothetical protein
MMVVLSIFCFMTFFNIPYFKKEGCMFDVINFYVQFSITMFGLIGMYVPRIDENPPVAVIFIICFVLVTIAIPIVLCYLFGKLYKSQWWLHPGGEMYVDPYNHTQLKPIKEKDPKIAKVAPRRPTLFGRIEVYDDIAIVRAEQEAEAELTRKKEEERLRKLKLRELGEDEPSIDSDVKRRDPNKPTTNGM